MQPLSVPRLNYQTRHSTNKENTLIKFGAPHASPYRSEKPYDTTAW